MERYMYIYIYFFKCTGIKGIKNNPYRTVLGLSLWGEEKEWDEETQAGASDYICNVFFFKKKTSFDTIRVKISIFDQARGWLQGQFIILFSIIFHMLERVHY